MKRNICMKVLSLFFAIAMATAWLQTGSSLAEDRPPGGGSAGGGGGTILPPAWNNPFLDVNETDWFYDAVAFVYSNGMMNGTSATTFSPDLMITRAMTVTILYRMAGAADCTGLANPYDDVPEGEWYTDPVKWLANNDIIPGDSNDAFHPVGVTTRQDVMVFLARYADLCGIKLKRVYDYPEFTDEADIADYAKESVVRCVQAGIFFGYPDGSFKPDVAITRAEFAVILYRSELWAEPNGEDITDDFKDAGFLAAVREIIGKPVGPIYDHDVAQIDELNLDSRYMPYVISDLAGIEHFVSLTYLDCSYQQLKELDLSKNIALTELVCYHNQLTALDLSKNIALNYLLCFDNQINTLNLSKNTMLMGLYCQNNQLTTLDLSNNIELLTVYCPDNLLNELDISNNLKLNWIHCFGNFMKSIDDVIGWQSIPGLILNETFIFYPQQTAVLITVTASTGGTVTGGGIYNEGDNVTLITRPNNNYTFGGWYENNVRVSGAGTTYTFAATTNRTLEARFTYTGGSSSGVGGIVRNDQIPATATTDAAIITDINTFNPPLSGTTRYGDVTPTDWFYDAVEFVSNEGLMNGTDQSVFSPNDTTNRAMLVTMLYRLEGSPPMNVSSPFSDVQNGQWYSNAVIWAAQNDIIIGYTDSTFGWNDPITREQAMTILCRYSESKGIDVSATADLLAYTDVNAISDWALAAVKWAVSNGIIQGRTNTTIVPQGISTRAEIAMIFMRYTGSLSVGNNVSA